MHPTVTDTTVREGVKRHMKRRMKYIKRTMAWLLAVTMLVTSVDYVQAAEAPKQTVSGNEATGDGFDVTAGDVSEGDVLEGDVSWGNIIEDSVPIRYGFSSSGEVLYSGTEAGITWSITSDGLLTIEGEYDAESGESITRPWLTYKTQIKTAVVTAKNVQDTIRWFEGCTNLTEIDLSGFDTSTVTSMGCMFKDCSSLTGLDVSGFDTGNVTSMSYMFENCSSLTSLDVSGFDTGNVTGMSYMFKGCSSLTSLDVGGFDTANVTTMGRMFWNCKSLTSLNVSDWDTGNVTTMIWMFCNCESLADLDISGWDTGSVTDMYGMFSGCSGLTSLDTSGLDTSNVTDMYGMFNECSGLSSLDLSGFKTDKATRMSYMLIGCDSLMELKCIPALQLDCDLPHTMKDKDGVEYTALPKGLTEGIWLYAQDYIGGEISGIEWTLQANGNLIIRGEYDGTPITGTELPWHAYADDIKSANITAQKVESTAYWFDGCGALESVLLSGFDTSKVTNMEAMFRNCEGLKSVDVSTLDMSKVTNANEMFSGCSGLRSIHTFNNLKISIALPHHMISGSKGEYTEYTEFPLNIQDDLWLTRGDLRGSYDGLRWYIFYDDEILYITGENTATELPGESTTYEWAGSFEQRFYYKVIVNAKGVLSTARWFKNCTNISELDLSGFDTASLVETTDMLTGCTGLEKVKTAPNLKVSMTFPATMYDEVAMAYTESPLNLTDSLELFKAEPAGAIQGLSWMILEDGTLVIGGTDTSTTVSDSTTWPWHEYSDDIKKVKIYAKNVKSTAYWFAGCNNLAEADLSDFDMQTVTVSTQMFQGCTNLKKLQTPLHVQIDTELPVMMVDGDETVYLSLPKGQSQSIALEVTRVYYGMNWVILQDGKLLVTGTYSAASDTDTSWLDYPAQIKSVKVTATGVKSTANWFYGLSKLETVDFSGFDTSLVTDMSGMFHGCSSLKSLDLSNFNTGNVTNMRGMFNNCYALTNVDVSKFDTSKVTDMGYLFNNCRALETLDLSKFDFSKVTAAERFLEGCSKIGKINTPKNLGLEIALPVGMVDEEQNIYLTLPMGMAESIVLDATQIVTSGSYNGMVWVLLKDGTLVIGGTDTSTTVSDSTTWPWHEYSGDIKKVKIYAKNVKSTAFWFSGCINLTETDFSEFDTSTVKNMSGMFQNCSSLETLDLSGFNMGSVSLADGMLDGCAKLKKIQAPLYVKEEVELPCGMLDANKNVYLTLPMGLTKSIALDGEQVVAAGKYCSMIWVVLKDGTLLITGTYGAASVKDTSWLDYATQITSVKVIATGVTSTANWFRGLSRLETVDISSFDTSLVTDMSGMFSGCSSLTSLDISRFDTSNVMDMSGMFSGCGSLTKLDLEHFVFSKDTDVSELLMGCVGLEEIHVPANLKVDIAVPKTLYNYLGEPQTDCFPMEQPEAEWYYAVSPVKEGEIHVSKVYPQTYTGKAIKPEIRIYDGANRLLDKKDFTITYKNNTKVASKDAVNTKGKSIAPTIIVKGKGNYTKSETITFDILAKDIADEDVTVNELVAVAGKKVQQPVPKLTYKGKKLVKGKDFTVSYPDLENKSKTDAYKKAGTYRVVVTGIGNFTGTRELAFTITDGTLMSKVKVSKIADQEYTGKAVEPAFKVTFKKTELVAGKDYTVTYKNNIEVGKASIVLTGRGAYAGTKTITFRITGQSIAKATVSGIEDKVYNGQAQTQQIKVELAGKTLNAGTDYVVSYGKNVNAGKASVTIVGKGAYTGSVKKTFKIKPYDLKENSKKLFKGVPGSLKVAYEKGGSTPEPELIFDGVNMAVKKDYTLSYANNKAVASDKDTKAPTITIKGKGNFTGTVTVPFTIVAKSLQDTENPVAIHVVDVAYAAKAGKYVSKPVLTDSNGKKLVAGTDYDKTIVYTLADGTVLDKTSKVEAGTTVKVKVTGMGCYTGTMETTYQITPAAFKSAKITIAPQVYTGKEITLTEDDFTSVKMGKDSLTYGEQYEIVEGSYKNNIKKGTASVTIKGKGNYGGEKTVKFKIVPKELIWFWRLFS